ncbi:MAG: metalloregulator ArsR/SmtB family transcription factor [Thermodesulfobacteriota bacterium]|nr:metalloregulator ArsR/SmtB family transcription factor [Thermodesulfobacteriota bacterium]
MATVLITGTCQQPHVHAETVDQVRKMMTDSNRLLALADIFKVLGDHTRVRILHALSFSELCVCDLADLLGMTPSAVSHQLRVLRSAKIVKYRKAGKNIFYSLDDAHVAGLMAEGLEHSICAQEDAPAP